MLCQFLFRVLDRMLLWILIDILRKDDHIFPPGTSLSFVLYILILMSICLKHIRRADYLVKNLEHPDPLEGRCPESNDQSKLFHRESVGGRNPTNHQPQLVIAGLLEINSLRLHQQYVSSFLNGPWFSASFCDGNSEDIHRGGIRKVPTGPRTAPGCTCFPHLWPLHALNDPNFQR